MSRPPDLWHPLRAAPLQGEVVEWYNPSSGGSTRSIRIKANLLVVSYTRQTFASRYRDGPRGAAVRRYNDAKNAMRDAFGLLLREKGIVPFAKGVRIGMSLWVTVPTERADLSNLFKAVEDAGNGVLYHDDRQIREYGPGGVRMGEAWIVLYLWELIGGGNGLDNARITLDGSPRPVVERV